MKRPIYMDHHATTPVLREVFDAMVPYMLEEFGNPSSTTHPYGKAAADAVELARRQVAGLIGASTGEIVFTSGATESNNLAIRGVLQANRERGNHLVTSAIEHEAVLETCKALEAEGCEVTYLPVDRYGLVDPEEARRSLRQGTVLLSVQTANNEIGTIQPVAEIARIAREQGVVCHTDAAQAVGRIAVNIQTLGVDLLSLSAHKMYGPKGVGALFVRRRTRIRPQLTGGGHEKNRRSGTLNVPGIVGLGRAAEIASREMTAEMERLTALRDRLWRRLRESVDHVELNGHPTRRLPNNLNVTFRYVEGEALLLALRDLVALSSGSACSSGTLEGSYVIRALGGDDQSAHGSIRFGLGRCNTEEQIDAVVQRIARETARLRALSPHYAAQSRT